MVSAAGVCVCVCRSVGRSVCALSPSFRHRTEKKTDKGAKTLRGKLKKAKGDDVFAGEAVEYTRPPVNQGRQGRRNTERNREIERKRERKRERERESTRTSKTPEREDYRRKQKKLR